MSTPIIEKNITDDYSNIDKEMFFLSLFNVYSNKNIDIVMREDVLGIPEIAYASLIDLPIFNISDMDLSLFIDGIIACYNKINRSDDIYHEFLNIILASRDRFFLTMTNEKTYYCKFINEYWISKVKTIGIADFNRFYRQQKLKIFFN